MKYFLKFFLRLFFNLLTKKRVIRILIENEEDRQYLKKRILNKTEKRAVDFLASGYLHDVGWFNSFTLKKPVNKDGNPIPWITYPFISLLEEKLKPDLNMFEFGCGSSTLFFSKRIKCISSVEHDEDWYNKINQEINTVNGHIYFQKLDETSDYEKTASLTGKKFDILFIDGRRRVACIKESINCLNDKGVIILDDSERPRYLEAFTFLETCGFKHLNFWGTAPSVFNHKCTTIFYRRENCLNI